jgi:hypothetical protein
MSTPVAKLEEKVALLEHQVETQRRAMREAQLENSRLRGRINDILFDRVMAGISCGESNPGSATLPPALSPQRRTTRDAYIDAASSQGDPLPDAHAYVSEPYLFFFAFFFFFS